MMKEHYRKARKHALRGGQPSKALRLADRTARLRAEMLPGEIGQFGIWLDYGGDSLFLVKRKSDALFEMLSPGVRLGDLRRFRPRRGSKSNHLGKSIDHLIKIVDDEVEQMAGCELGQAPDYGWGA